eukprot:107693-Prymnesium_polylepis.1
MAPGMASPTPPRTASIVRSYANYILFSNHFLEPCGPNLGARLARKNQCSPAKFDCRATWVFAAQRRLASREDSSGLPSCSSSSYTVRK